jgi:dipeptidyl aminopeptidase/acylaminoacyl peptidase
VAVPSAVALLAVVAPAAAQERFALEDLLAAPYPAELVASPVGGRVAWVQNDRGVRNIWVAGPPDYEGRPVTGYSRDDGQELGSLAWAPDGRTIVYVRGGGANGRGEHPNPESLPERVEQAIWAVSAEGGAPRRLAEGSGPAVSPRGDVVAFIRGGQAWSVPLVGGEAKPLFEARGRTGSLRWSPDGRRIAFVSQRGTHAFVGVYDLVERRIRWLDPSVHRDGNPVWSPDGRRVAFIRIPAVTRRLVFGARREGPPWSIRVADVETGRGREVWRAAEGRGSVFRGVVASNQLFWARGEGCAPGDRQGGGCGGDRLVFPWEGDGWTHLHSVAVDGDPAAVLLTPGDFEVEHVALGADGRTIYYSSNQDDIDRRHLWRVPADGGSAPEALTSGKGIEWGPTVAGDGTVYFLRSDARRPARPARLVGRGGEVAELVPGMIPASFPADRLVEPQPVVMTAADGVETRGQLFLPPDLKPGEKRPAVIFFHGGSRRQMLLGWHPSQYYHNAYAFNQYLASRGYIVLSANYRSGIGYGLEFREALDYGATGASEYADVLAAAAYLRSRDDVDVTRIGLWGGSYGGYLTALGLARNSDLFAAGVDLHGVHDWNLEWDEILPHWDLEARQRAHELMFRSSPMADVEGWRSPVLMVHGDDDRNVAFEQTIQLTEDLTARGVEVELLIFPDEVHSFLRYESWVSALRAAADFFDRHLGAGRAAADR